MKLLIRVAWTRLGVALFEAEVNRAGVATHIDAEGNEHPYPVEVHQSVLAPRMILKAWVKDEAEQPK